MASHMLPSSVSFFMSRLQGVSTTSFKIFPDTATSGVSGGQIIRFSLPANTLLNFRSIRWLFNCTTTNGTDAGSIPASTSSLIDRLALYAGGVLVQNGHQNYHILRHAKYALCGSKDNPTLEHPEFVRKVSYHDGSDLGTGTNNESYTDIDDALGVLSWEGFLGSCEPYILDTGLLPQLTLEITLADGVVFGSSKGRLMSGTGSNTDFDDDGTVACTYTLNNLSLECEVLGMASSVLDQIVEQRISSVGYLSIPFKQYFTTINTHTGSTKFNVNSASWDRLWITYRADNADQVGAPRVVNGYKVANANVVRSSALVNGAVSSSATLVIDNLIGEAPKVGDVVKAAGIVTRVTITAVNSATNYTMSAAQSISDNAAVTFERDVGAPQYDVGGSLDTNKEKYQSKFFQFKYQIGAASSSPTFTQLQINNASIPAYRMNIPEAYAQTLNAVDMYDKSHKLTLDQYKNNYYVNCFRFCLPGSDFDRLSSGLDTRSVSAQSTLITDNLASTTVNLFAEVTSEMRVGAGRSIEIIV
jgi:hypothetical protein